MCVQDSVTIFKVALILLSVGPYLATAQNWRPVLEGPYGNELKACSEKWSKISNNAKEVSECMTKLIFAIAPRFAAPEGIDVIGTKSFNPIHIPHIVLADTPVLQGNLTDLKLYNATQYLREGYTSITYDPIKKIATMITRGEHAEGEGGYSLRLNLGALLNSEGSSPAATSGTVSTGRIFIRATDPQQIITLHMRETKSGKGLTVSKVDSKPNFGKIDLRFAPFGRDDALGNLLNTMITGDTAASLINDFVAPAGRATSQGVGNLFHKGWWKLDQL